MKPMAIIAGGLVFLIVAGGVFTLKHTVEQQRDRLHALEAQIRKDRQAIGILRTEWTHLSAPARIQALTDRHLALQPLSPMQIIESPSQIPPRTGHVLAVAPPDIPLDMPVDRPAAAVNARPQSADEGDFAARMRAAIAVQGGGR